MRRSCCAAAKRTDSHGWAETRVLKSRFRLIAASNGDLAEAVRKGSFRKDLFYRICVAPLHIPPLRERQEDIRAIAEYFLSHFSRFYGQPSEGGFSGREMALLLEYPWPGNVREMRTLWKLCIFAAPPPRFKVRRCTPRRPMCGRAQTDMKAIPGRSSGSRAAPSVPAIRGFRGSTVARKSRRAQAPVMEAVQAQRKAVCCGAADRRQVGRRPLAGGRSPL